MENVSKVALADGREVLLSYGVPVAAFLPGRGYVRTDARYSVTTSRHANTYAGKSSPTMVDAEFRAAILPVVGK
jgi:hypothetical protein